MGVINVLDFQIANLIAAGEVVERPASAVKELIENSIDAGASEITVEIKRGGVSFIRVSDNGCGMAADDMPVAIKRHATSKISTALDLDNIMTLGFRGEALAAIASVSKLRIMSKRKEDAFGTQLTSESGKVVDICEVGCKDGTTVIVEELFANVPARRKFLKKDASEGAAVISIVQKVALSHPDIAIKMINNGVIEFCTQGDGRTERCIYAVMGREFASKMINVNYVTDRIEVYGYIGRPDNVRANRNFQNFYINSRYVRSKTATAALETAFDSYLEAGKFPTCVLYINIHPAFVDVNVHPTKLEVKFSNEKAVFEAIYCAVKNAILSSTDRPEVLFEREDIKAEDHSLYNAFVPVYDRIAETESKKVSRDALFEEPSMSDDVSFSAKAPQGDLLQDRPDNEAKDMPESKTDSKPDNKPFSGRFELDTEEENEYHIFSSNTPEKAENDVKSENVTIQSNENLNSKNVFRNTAPYFSLGDKSDRLPCPEYRILGEAFKAYIGVECDNTVLLVDKHAAHERILFEQMKNIMRAQRGAGQLLLIPFEVALSDEEYTSLAEYRADIENVGFRLEDSNIAKSVYITQVPMGFSQDEACDMFVSMVGALADNTGSIESTKEHFFEKALYQASCKAATKAGMDDTEETLRWIVESILRNPEIRYCPHGRPVAIEISKSQIEKIFKRT